MSRVVGVVEDIGSPLTPPNSASQCPDTAQCETKSPLVGGLPVDRARDVSPEEAARRAYESTIANNRNVLMIRLEQCKDAAAALPHAGSQRAADKIQEAISWLRV